MAVASCTVVAGGGGWTATGDTYPTNQNDADVDTYQGWPGDTAGTNSNYYDYTQVPDGAVISLVGVSGGWSSGSASGTASFRYVIGGDTTTLGTVGDVSSYSFSSATAPAGGSWTKTDIQNLHMDTVSLQTGNGNPMRIQSSVLTVTYVLSGMFLVSIY